MRSAFARGAAPLVVNLGGGDVTMAEQFLDFHDVDAGIEQERGSGGAQRVRRVDAFHHFVAVRQFPFPKRVGELAQIFLQDGPHGPRLHRGRRQFLGMGMPARSEEGTARDVGAQQVLVDRLRCSVVQADGAALVAFFAQTQRGLLALLAKVFDEERAAGGQADAGIEVEFYNRAVAMRQYRIARRHVQQLPGARRRQGQRFFARIGRLARDELRMRRVGDQDRQAQLGRRQRQVLVKGGQRRNAVVDRFGRGADGGQDVAVRLHVGHGDGQECRRFLRPHNPAMPDEGQNPVPVGAAGVDTFGAVDPALEDFINRAVEMFDPAADLRREGTGEDRRQRQQCTGGRRNHGDSFRRDAFEGGFRR